MYNAYQTTEFKKNIFNQTEPLTEPHATRIIPAVSCGHRRQ